MSRAASLVADLRDDLDAMLADLEIAVEDAVPPRFIALTEENGRAIESGAEMLNIKHALTDYRGEAIADAFGDFNWKLRRLLSDFKAQLEIRS